MSSEGSSEGSSEVIELLQSLIRNQCVNTGKPDSGHEHRSVATLQEFFGHQGQVFEPAPGRQSLVYRVKGSDPSAPSLALVPHIDVVPVDPEGWTQDPFGADIVDGFVYGRGAVDMLNIVAAFAEAVRPYIRGERQPRGDIVFAAMADEEAGGSKGAYPLTRDHWDLVGTDYLLTEVAYPTVSIGSGQAVPVAIGEKGSYFSQLKTTGAPGHGSVPYGSDNALDKIVHALHRLLANPSPPFIGPQWEEFVCGLGLAPDLAQALVDPDRVDEAIAVIAKSDSLLAGYFHASTHMTVSANQAQAGSKANIIADRASVILDIRSLPGMDRELVEAQLKTSMGPDGDAVKIVPRTNNPSSISGTSNTLWNAIGNSLRDTVGHDEMVPTLMPVATDARYWRRKGTISYGVGLYDDATSFSDLLARFHGNDERISVESVQKTGALYRRILHHLDEDDSA